MLKVLSMDEYRIEMLKEIDSFVWNGYPYSKNIRNKEYRSIRIKSIYVEMLMKGLGLDKDKIEKIWNKEDAHLVFSLLKDSMKRLNIYVDTGSQLQRDNARYLLKRLNDKL